MKTQQRLLTQAPNRAEHCLTEVYKILRSSLGPGSSVWEKGRKRGQVANRKNIGERAFSDNAEPGPRLLVCACFNEIEASKGEVA